MSDNENDILNRFKNTGYYLAQDIYNNKKEIDSIEKLIKKYTSKMFNYIHSNRVHEFVFYLEKIYADNNQQPSKILIEILKIKDHRKFKDYSLSFIMGFMSPKK